MFQWTKSLGIKTKDL